MPNPNWINVVVDNHLTDCPPHDEAIPTELISEIAQEVCSRFDYTSIYDQIDTIACQILREKGLIS